MSQLDHEKLKLQVADPEWPERLLPLFLFKGTKPSRIHTLWNIAYAMYLSECESFGDGIKTVNTLRILDRNGKKYQHWNGHPNDLGHLCGLHSPLQNSSLYGIFGRMRGCPELTDSVDRGFTEYVKFMHPYNCVYERVSQVANRTDTRSLAWWRTPREHMRRGRKPRWPWGDIRPKVIKVRAPKIIKPKPQAWYMKDARSYLPPSGKNVSADVALMHHIHTLVPKGLPHEIRGDLCQDLLVAVLSGEVSVVNLPDLMGKFARDARKIMPDRWRTVSWEGINRVGEYDMDENIGAAHEHF